MRQTIWTKQSDSGKPQKNLVMTSDLQAENQTWNVQNIKTTNYSNKLQQCPQEVHKKNVLTQSLSWIQSYMNKYCRK